MTNLNKLIKKKWINFLPSGIQCAHCGAEASYIACDSHHDNFPELTDKNHIRVPNCKFCSIECQVCFGEILSLPKYLHKIKNPNKPVKKKLIKKRLDPEIKSSFLDKLQQADLSNLRDLEIFRNSTRNILNLIFSFDLGTQLATDDVERILEELDVGINFGAMRSSNDRLSRLMFTLLMIRASGLSSYEKAIMESEIERIYAPNISGDQKANLMELLKNYIKHKGEN